MVFVIFIIFTALCHYVITVDFAEHLSLEVYPLCWLTVSRSHWLRRNNPHLLLVQHPHYLMPLLRIYTHEHPIRYYNYSLNL